MKRFLLVLFAFISINSLAQLEVKEDSFKEVPGFVNINTEKMYDDNDKPYAVLKIKTENINSKERHELNFGGDAQTFWETEYKDGEVWLYISYYASFIKISHEDYSSTELYFPFEMKPKHGYEVTLVNKSFVSNVPVKEQYNYLIVKTDQSNAIIYIDGQYAGDGEAAKSFKIGETHQWSIECDMYYPESGSATIEKEKTITVNKKLRPAFGYINITSTPESGATVFVDNKRIGLTPCKTDKLPSGEHIIKVLKEMFNAAEKTVTVTDGQTVDAVITMTANSVVVNISTDSQSEIYVDNENKGKGTWHGRLSEGEHVFEAKKSSHKTTIKNVTLTLGKVENIIIPDPIPIYGTLDINSSPMGATILIDGKNCGETPQILNNILIGTHNLKLDKIGYKSITKTFTLDNTNKLNLTEKLEEYVYEAPEIEEEDIQEAEVFKVVEEMPEFPGGTAKLLEFIQKNMRYPMKARESDIQGKVYIQFVVETDGSISNANVLRGIGGGCDEEAVRIVNSMPKFKPGKQRGTPVRVQYMVPIVFKLQ